MTILIVAIIAVLLASQFVRDEGLPPGEFFTLTVFATAGMLMLASAGDLVMVFLGLEIASITTYVMAGYRRYDVRANESSLKYFLLGSFATAFLLYGMALVYGATGTTNIARIRAAISAGQIEVIPRFAADRRGDDAGRVRLQDRQRAVPSVDAGRLRRRADASSPAL